LHHSNAAVIGDEEESDSPVEGTSNHLSVHSGKPESVEPSPVLESTQVEPLSTSESVILPSHSDAVTVNEAPITGVTPDVSTSVIVSSEGETGEIHSTAITDGPVEGWRNSTDSSDDAHDHTPEHKRKGKKGHIGTHAEVASSRKHLKKCTMS
jgi:hypothetical protein